MTALTIHAEDLRLDEACYRLCEMNLVSPLGKMRRYQLIQVVRGDRKRWFRIDMGPSTNAEEFRIVADGDRDTVGYVQSIAHRRREDETLKKWLAEQPPTLIKDFLETEEESIRIRHNKSQFGPAGFTPRNGFNRRKA